jgi:hypothetical protein
MVRWYRLEGRTPVLDPTERLQPAEQRRVARTEISSDVCVSTVFLGLDHGSTVEGPPVLFETMVFAPDTPFDQEQERYTTYDEAEAGHQQWVARARALLNALQRARRS